MATVSTVRRSRAMPTAEVLALRERFVPKGLAVATPVVVASADGAMVTDPEGREYIVAFQNPFHGRTYAAMTATGKTKNSRLPFLRSTSTNVVHVPYPYPYRPLVAGTEDELAALHARLLEQVLETSLAPEHVAAVMLEPVQGEGGFIVPPAAFIPRLAEICKRHGILLIADD